MVGEQDAVAAFLEVADYRLKVRDRYRVDAAERLVEQYEMRLEREAARYLDAAALAAREGDALRVLKVLEAVVVEQRGNFVAAHVRGDAGLFKHEVEILAHREAAEDGGLLRQIAYSRARALVHRQSGELLPAEPYVSGVGDDAPDYHVEGRALARAVRPEQPYYLALLYLDADFVDDAPPAEALDELLGAQGVGRGFERHLSALHPAQLFVAERSLGA